MAPSIVLHLRDTHEIGGPGKTILETHRLIDRERFCLHLAVLLTNEEPVDSPFVQAARDYGMPVHTVRARNQYDPRVIPRLANLTRTIGARIVHAHEASGDMVTYLASRLHRVPIVTTLHGWIGNSLKQRAQIAADKYVIRGFDRVIAVSAEIQRQVVESGVSPGKVVLLHNAIVAERYRRTGRRGYLSGLLGGTPPGPVVMSIGRLSAEKGHADLIDALALVARQGHTVAAVIAGDGPERGRLMESARALGIQDRVYFPGYVSPPNGLLEESDLFVLPSHTEGLPNAVLEALLMEVPVLATSVGGTPEVVVDGQSGRLVPPKSPHDLARGIVDFLCNQDAWKEMALRGRKVVESHFGFDVRTRKLETVYEGLGERTR